MKRHLEKPTPQPVPVPTLSVEEEAILQDEHNEASIAVDAATAEADRITEVAEVAQDAVLVVDETPEVGQVEQDLVGAVGDMAVAGTDADPEEVISLPVTDGQDVSVEGIVSTLKSIWDAIVTAIKNMWVGLKHWLTTYFSTLEQNKKHAEKLIERLNGMKGYVPNIKNDKIEIKDIFNYANIIAGLNLSELFGGIAGRDKRFEDFVVGATDTQGSLMVNLGHAIAEGYDKFDGINVSELGDMVDFMSRKMGEYCKKLGLSKGDGKDKDKYTFNVAQMKVEAEGFSDTIENQANSFETKLAYLCKIRFKVDQHTSFAAAGVVSYRNDTTPDMVKADVQHKLNFINQLIAHKDAHFKQLEEAVQKVEQACSKMLERVKEDNKEGMTTAKRLMPLTSAYANWATQPAAKLLDVAARHNKFWLSLSEMVTNNFQEPAAA
jgi:hypothetical protein